MFVFIFSIRYRYFSNKLYYIQNFTTLIVFGYQKFCGHEIYIFFEPTLLIINPLTCLILIWIVNSFLKILFKEKVRFLQFLPSILCTYWQLANLVISRAQQFLSFFVFSEFLVSFIETVRYKQQGANGYLAKSLSNSNLCTFYCSILSISLMPFLIKFFRFILWAQIKWLIQC